MGLIKCLECGKDISDQAETCPNCGYPLQKKLKEKVEDSIVEEIKDTNEESDTEASDVIQNINEEKKENKTVKEGKHIFGWIISIFTFLFAWLIYNGINSLGSVIAMLFAGIFVCPKFIKYLNDKFNKRISMKMQIMAYIVLFMMSIFLTPTQTTKNIDNDSEKNIVAEVVEESEEEKAQRKAEEEETKKKEIEEKAAAEAQKKADEEAAVVEAQKKAAEEKAVAEAQKVNEENTYKSSCESIAYKDIARNPDNYMGKKVKFTGQVVQVQEDYSLFGKSNSITIRLAVTKDSYGFWDDYVYCTYTYSIGESKILEEDIITIYGECKGDISYVSVLGSNITLPEVSIKYLTIEE